MSTDLTEYIERRKKELNAVILAHYYQRPEIQDAADFVGDSLQLAIQAASTEAEVIVFCGVTFMAESAKILNPDKIVILPELQAGCPMADMATGEALRAKKAEMPGVKVVCYVNSSAEVKAESDICCTSANAVQVVESLPPECPILFVPDQNLGHYIARQTGRNITLWEGYCPVHHVVSLDQLLAARRRHPEAVVMVHPECPPEVIEVSDHVLSTGGMLKLAQNDPAQEFIVGTEEGLLYQLQKQNPGKEFHIIKSEFICETMKLTTIDKLVQSLENLEPRIEVPEDIRLRAQKALDRMIQIQ